MSRFKYTLIVFLAIISMPALLFAWEGKVVDNARLDSTILQNLMGMSNLGKKEWPLWAITGAIMWKEGTRTSH